MDPPLPPTPQAVKDSGARRAGGVATVGARDRVQKSLEGPKHIITCRPAPLLVLSRFARKLWQILIVPTRLQPPPFLLYASVETQVLLERENN
jgi:hypothetical protein